MSSHRSGSAVARSLTSLTLARLSRSVCVTSLASSPLAPREIVPSWLRRTKCLRLPADKLPWVRARCRLRHGGADGRDRVYQGVLDVATTDLAGRLIWRLEGHVDRVRVLAGDFGSCPEFHADEGNAEVEFASCGLAGQRLEDKLDRLDPKITRPEERDTPARFKPP